MIIDRRPYVTCLCGTQIHAATLFDAWQLFDRHVDQTHGRTFPIGSVRLTPAPEKPFQKRPKRKPPITPQGGQS